MNRSWLPLVSFLLLVACRGEQGLVDDCVGNDACPACDADADCEIGSNTCEENAFCTSVRRDPALAVTQIGCNVEYDRPPAAACGCVDHVCRSR